MSDGLREPLEAGLREQTAAAARAELMERIARTIHDADYMNEPWKKFDTLAAEHQEEYRSVADAVIGDLGLTEEMLHQYIGTGYQWQRRWVSGWSVVGGEPSE